MAAHLRVLLHLLLAGIVSSEVTKLKSNPDGNFAIGFERGYINAGKYGVIVPKGDEATKREVQIRGPVRDSVIMEFNSQTIVFSNWDGWFMLGEMVYTDTLGTLYFVRIDKKCVRKVYKKQMGEIQVVEKQDLDRIVCEAVRTKVEKAVSQFINSPFKYLLPTASDELKHTPGFPGGDFIQGLKHGEVTCGQHFIDVPTGDEHEEKTVKITAPGVYDEVKMVFDSDTMVFGSWNGVFYLGDKVFSIQPKTLVFKKGDGSCVKKYYDSKGSEIVVDRSVLLKQEDCFLIMSQAYGAMQTHRKPSLPTEKETSEEKEIKKKKKKKSKDSSSSENFDSDNPKIKIAKQQKTSSQSKQQSPPPIHVTSTVVIPKDKQTAQNGVSPSTIVVPLQNNPYQPQLIPIPGDLSQNYYLQNTNNPQSSVVLQPLTAQAPLLYTQNNDDGALGDVALGGPNKIVNIQNNDIDLNLLGQPIGMQNIDPNQQEILPEGYIRIGRSVSSNPSQDNVINNQELNIDSSAILAARKGKSDTQIIGIQKSNIVSPNAGDSSSAESNNLKTTQITTVTLPSDSKKMKNTKTDNGKRPAQDIIVDTNVILDQDSQPKSNKDSVTLLPVRTIPHAVAAQGGKVVNLQKNEVTLGKQGSSINIQKNVVKLNSPTLVNTFMPVINAAATPGLLVRIARNIKNSDLNSVTNFQKNNVGETGSGDVTNIQQNQVDVDIYKPTSIGSARGSLLSFDIPKPTKILNVQDNDVNVDGVGNAKNIQSNNVELSSLGIPVTLADKTPQVPPKIPNNVYVQQLVQNNVVNYQDNNVRLNGEGSVKNIQLNKIDGDVSYAKIVKKRSPLFVGVARRVSDPIYFQNQEKEILNIQKNVVSSNGLGDETNIQRNIVESETNSNILGRPLRNQNLFNSHTKNINLQNNDVTVSGIGDVKNIQTNSVIDNQPSAIILGRRKKRSISQDVLNNQLVTIDGSSVASSASQGGKVFAVQDNSIVAPVGLDGLPIIPDMKSSQVTNLELPPQPGSPRSQAPQKMYIKTNVLYKQTPQQTQSVPVYVQASPVVNPPTIVQVGPSAQPQIVLAQQPQGPRQTLVLSNNQPSILVPAASLRQQGSQTNQRPAHATYVIANGASPLTSQVHSGGTVHTVTRPSGGPQTFTVAKSPTYASGQGRIPVTLMKDLTLLKKLYNPSNMIVNIAQNTNFQKK